jgi:hypothetical protein
MPHRFRQLSVSCAVAALLSACGLGSTPAPLYQQEEFDVATSPYARTFQAKPEATCEAARRALLSQGYIAMARTAELIEGSKSFQPDPELNLQMNIRVVCVPETADGQVSIGFVTALQDRYTLKKSANSASLGVGALGSVSLPFSSGSDSMVKVGSETIAKSGFYDSFFELVSRYLAQDRESIAVPTPVAPQNTIPSANH